MGKIVVPTTGPVYIDTSVLIYRIEQIEPFLLFFLSLWEALENEQIEIITSELTYLETLVKPYQRQHHILISRYKTIMLETIGFSLIPITISVLERAILLRADFLLKTPDAIHAATGIVNNCSMFVTNDPVFKRIPGFNVLVLNEIIADNVS